MKIAIVKLSTVQKYQNWDARFYLGDPELPRYLEKTQHRVRIAQTRCDEIVAEMKNEVARLVQMKKEGEIK